MAETSNWVMKLPAEKLLAMAAQLKEKRRAAYAADAATAADGEETLPPPSPAARAAPAPPAPEGLAAAAPPIMAVRRDGDLPLSFGQERLWFLDRLDPGRSFYNLPTALRLRGPLDVGALAASHAEIVRRHEALRTRFGEVDGRPVQRIAPPSAPGEARPLLVDLAALPAERREAEALALAGGEAARPFDLARGPLQRAVVVALAGDEHLALFTMHHIVSDGWSIGVLVRELGAFYAACVQGAPPPLPPLPVQYADFAVWQRAWLSGAVLERRLAFWRRSLAGAPPVLELPLDRPRPPLQTFRGATSPLALSPELSRRWNALGRHHDATLFMSLLAALSALLARLTGEDDVVVGTPIAGRSRLEIEGLIGFFVNTLALRADLAGDPDGPTLLARIRERTLATYAHQDLPFERLVEELQPERSLAVSPLFQVLFALQNAPAGRLQLAGLTLEPVAPGGPPAAKFELSLFLGELPGGEGIAGGWEYNTDLFDAATIERLSGWLTALVAGWLERPQARLSELPILAPAEQHQLAAWGSGGALPAAAAAASAGGLQAGFFAWAAVHPADEAILWGDERITYGDLAARASRLARRLAELGGGAETLVGVCLPRSPELVAALLAVLAAGSAYLPLDPRYPAERLTFMLADAGAPLVLAHADGPDLAPDLVSREGRRLVYLDDDGERATIARQSGEALAPRAGGGNLAYVLYTSGSTGRPKGVAIEHRSVLALFAWAAPLFAREIGARGELGCQVGGVLAGTSISFDVSIFELFFTLAHGGRVILAADALALPRLPAAGEVTLLNAVPSAVAELLRMGAVPRSVRTVNLPGEPLSGKLVADLYATGHVERVFNLYGPSEDTTYSTFAAVPAPAPALPAREPAIGRPIIGTVAHVLDRHQRPAPLGVVGELFLGGAGLARGYFARPALTAERFVPDPFGGAGARLYRTGDLVRYRPSGELEFVARRDQQVKLRGFRIEPGEVEAALAAQPAVGEAAVVLRRGRSGEPELAAFYSRRREAPSAPAAAELRAALAARLPEHMVPSAFVEIAALPLNPNGKIDRRALAALPVDGDAETAAGAAFQAPRDEVERELAAIWEELLGLPRVSVADSFFELGGHSLLAVRLMSRIARRFGRELPLATLFRAPTVRRLAAVLRGDAALGEEVAGVAGWTPLVELAGGGREAAAPPPFFCVHPIGGAVFCYQGLARRLGGGRPFIGIQARGLAGGEPPFQRIEEMAAVYREAITAAQPAGPYHLGGWSFGALVALEIAGQLVERGAAVAYLALIDPTTISAEERALPEDDVGALLVVARDLAGMAGIAAAAGGPPLGLARGDLEPLIPEARLDLVLARATAAGGLPADADPAQLGRLMRLYLAHVRAIRAYAPPRYPGPIAVFCAADRPLARRLDVWEAVAGGGLAARAIPGGHYDLLREPQLEALAEGLAAGLAAAAEPELEPGAESAAGEGIHAARQAAAEHQGVDRIL